MIVQIVSCTTVVHYDMHTDVNSFYSWLFIQVYSNIGADSTGATGNFAPVLTQEPGQTLRFASVPFMAVLWFFKWTLQLYLLNLTKGAKFACSVGHPMTKMLSASGGAAPGPRWRLCPQTPIRLVLRTRHGAPPTTDPFRHLWLSNWTLPR